MAKHMGLGVRITWARALRLGTLLNLSEPQLPHLHKGNGESAYFTALPGRGTEMMAPCQYSAQCLALMRSSSWLLMESLPPAGSPVRNFMYFRGKPEKTPALMVTFARQRLAISITNKNRHSVLEREGLRDKSRAGREKGSGLHFNYSDRRKLC